MKYIDVRAMCKLDFKEYDRVSWPFLLKLLESRG